MSDVSIRALRKTLGGNQIVDDIDLNLEEGAFVTLLGPSGCGKTTTLRCVAGLEEPDGGQIEIAGQTVADADKKVHVPPNRRDVGMVFQSYALWPHMTVQGNVAYPLKRKGVPRRQIATEVRDALDLVGLTDQSHRPVPSLSGGQQQRVALARALVGRPAVLLLDEPLSNLDARLRTQLRRDLRQIHQSSGSTWLYVTHDQVEAVTMSDLIVVMNTGRIEQSGSPTEIFNHPRTRYVADFVGFDNMLRATVTQAGGSEIRVRPTGWETDLTCAATEPVQVGALATVAFRSSAVSLDPQAPMHNRVHGTVVAVTYLGDKYELSVDVYGQHLTILTDASPHVPTSGQELTAHIPSQRLVAIVHSSSNGEPQ